MDIMKKYEWDSLVDEFFYYHDDNYVRFSLPAKSWKYYTYDYILAGKFTKHSCILALESLFEMGRFSVKDFIDCIEECFKFQESIIDPLVEFVIFDDWKVYYEEELS